MGAGAIGGGGGGGGGAHDARPRSAIVAKAPAAVISLIGDGPPYCVCGSESRRVIIKPVHTTQRIARCAADA